MNNKSKKIMKYLSNILFILALFFSMDVIFASNVNFSQCNVLNSTGTVQCFNKNGEPSRYFKGSCQTEDEINAYATSNCAALPNAGNTGNLGQSPTRSRSWSWSYSINPLVGSVCDGSCNNAIACNNKDSNTNAYLWNCGGTCVEVEHSSSFGGMYWVDKDPSECSSRPGNLYESSRNVCTGVVCLSDKKDYLVKFANSNGGQEPSAVFQDGSSLVMGGEITADGSLELDLNGSIGATEYCDENGDNCVLAADLGSGGGVNGGGDLDDLNNTDTSSCDVVGEVLTWTNNLNGDNTTGDNGWICSDQLAGNWTYTTNVSTDNTLTYDGGDTDMVVIDDASSAVDSNIELLVHGDISADRFCSGVDADTGNCLTIPDTACTGTDVLAWTDDANGDATTGDYGWSCQEVTTADGSLMALSDTNVTTCADGSALVYNSDWDNDNANSGDSDEKDDNEWRCQSANEPVWAGLTASTYNGNQAGYSGTKNICGSTNADYPGSHICSASEVTTLLSNGLSFPTATNNQFWVNNGAPGYVATPSNDCAGWTSDSSATYGSVLAKSPSGAVRFLISPCDNNNARQFACCF
jgi:hypothetical protein